MATNRLEISIDASDVEAFVAKATEAGESLPHDSRERFVELILGLLDGGGLKLAVIPRGPAASAGNSVVRLGVVGMDELLATALATAKGELAG